MPSSEPNFDARMVDWLYDELDPAEATSFEKHLEANPEVLAEANALRRTREAFREMDQSEPAPGLSSMLMHEAAQAVAKSPSLWARITGFFQPVFLHPAASAMATIVVVAGVAGALYSRNGDMSVDTKYAESPSEAPADYSQPAMAAPDPTPAAEAAEAEEEPPAEESDADEQRNDGYRVGLASERAQDEISAIEETRNAKAPKGAFGSDMKSGKRAKQKSNKSFGDGFALSEGEMAARESGPGNQVNAVSGGRGYAPPPPKQPATVTSKSFDDSAVSAKKRARPAKPSRAKNAPSKLAADISKEDNRDARKLSWEDEKTRVLNAAAKDKRCQDAGRIANDILDKKPTYYRKQVEGSKAVKNCGRYVASETKRRAKLRKAQARKKAAGSMKKAKAAPRLESDQALD